MSISTTQLSEWLDRYFLAWQTNDPEDVAGLFSQDAVYFYGPFKEGARGRDTIVANWISNPDGQSHVRCAFEVLAVEDDLGIAHWNVLFDALSPNGKQTELDGILVLKFNPVMECVEHREWYSRRTL